MTKESIRKAVPDITTMSFERLKASIEKTLNDPRAFWTEKVDGYALAVTVVKDTVLVRTSNTAWTNEYLKTYGKLDDPKKYRFAVSVDELCSTLHTHENIEYLREIQGDRPYLRFEVLDYDVATSVGEGPYQMYKFVRSYYSSRRLFSRNRFVLVNLTDLGLGDNVTGQRVEFIQVARGPMGLYRTVGLPEILKMFGSNGHHSSLDKEVRDIIRSSVDRYARSFFYEMPQSEIEIVDPLDPYLGDGVVVHSGDGEILYKIPNHTLPRPDKNERLF